MDGVAGTMHLSEPSYLFMEIHAVFLFCSKKLS